jgi:citrate lyase beta subunit
MRARRALLYMPGDDMRKIQKATTLGVDCICMDMEDGVALNRKVVARSTILSALQNLDSVLRTPGTHQCRRFRLRTPGFMGGIARQTGWDRYS